MGGPRYVLENGLVSFKGSCSEGLGLALRGWLYDTASYRLLIAPYREKLTHDDVELYIRIILAATSLAREKYGVPTVILYARGPEDYLRGTGFTDDDIFKRLQQGDPSVIDISLRKEQAAGARLSIPGDGHPTPYANQLRASILKTYIEQHFPEIIPVKSTQCADTSHASVGRPQNGDRNKAAGVGCFRPRPEKLN